SDAVLQQLGTPAIRVESSAPTPAILLIRYMRRSMPHTAAPASPEALEAPGDRLLVINLAGDYHSPMNDPLMAPPRDGDWTLLWSSEHPQYGGGGTVPFVEVGRWLIRGQSALLLAGNA